MAAPAGELLAAVGAATGLDLSAARAVGGGSINDCHELRDAAGGRWFLKLNAASRAGMFAAEAEGLGELAAADALRVPRVAGHGAAQGRAWLLLEYLEIGGATPRAAAALGTALAAQHRVIAPQFGWRRDNTIGATPQPNGPLDDWPAFFARRRLGFQLELAARGGAGRDVLAPVEALIARLDAFFTGHAPAASLLHGDLWGGNWGALPGGEPVIFDPAVYFGDREADIAMTRLFGGFPEDFYRAYEDAWPLAEGFALRCELYNLYHVLNHLNLFGGGYGQAARRSAERLLAEVS